MPSAVVDCLVGRGGDIAASETKSNRVSEERDSKVIATGAGVENSTTLVPLTGSTTRLCGLDPEGSTEGTRDRARRRDVGRAIERESESHLAGYVSKRP